MVRTRYSIFDDNRRLAATYEKIGLLSEAWCALAEAAHEASPGDPVHNQLLGLEERIRKAQAGCPNIPVPKP